MPFEARASRIRILCMLLGCALFAVLGLWMSGVLGDGADTDTFGRIIGWVAVAFFVLLIPIGVARLVQGGVVMRVDAEGVYWRRWSDQVIPWSAIRAVNVGAVRRQRFLNLVLNDPAAFPSKSILGRIRRVNTAMGFGDISLNVTETDRSFADLLAAFDRFAPAELRAQEH